MVDGTKMNFTEEQKEHIIKTKKELFDAVGEKLSIFDSIISMTIKQCFVLSGGAIGSFLRGESPNDFDFFPTTDVDYFLNKIEKTYQDGIEDAPEENAKYMEQVKGKIVTANAITMKGKVQLIRKFDSFDFVHCLPKFDVYNYKFKISPLQYHCIMNKILIVNEGVEPKPTRIQKFVDRGWKMM